MDTLLNTGSCNNAQAWSQIRVCVRVRNIFCQKSGAQTHTELHVGDRCSHRWKLHIHRWIGTYKNTPSPTPNTRRLHPLVRNDIEKDVPGGWPGNRWVLKRTDNESWEAISRKWIGAEPPSWSRLQTLSVAESARRTGAHFRCANETPLFLTACAPCAYPFRGFNVARSSGFGSGGITLQYR